MKKVLAIILTVVMLMGVVAIGSSAEETTATPKVTIITNEGSPVDTNVATYFTVRFDNFDSAKGLDVTITADNSITLSEVSTSGFPNAASENSNYTVKSDEQKHSIRFVDLTGSKDGKIIFKASVDTAVDTDPTITVSGEYATDGKTKFDIETPAIGTFELVREIKPTTVDSASADNKVTVTPAADTFIPYGSVYKETTDSVVFADKEDNGSFIIAEDGYEYKSYAIPTNKITTFGASDDPKDNTKLRFGSYSELYSGDDTVTHGTMVFEGDWLALKNYYIKNGYTVQQFTKAIYNSVSSLLEGSSNSFVYYNVPTGVGEETTQVNVYLFAQKNYMWRNADTNILEYAIRLDGIETGTTYTAVAYSVAGETVTISENVKSVTK